MRALLSIQAGSNFWPPETRLDCHYEHHIDDGEQGIGQAAQRVEGLIATRTPSFTLDPLREGNCVGSGFEMKSDPRGTGFGDTVDPQFRVLDHQMAVEVGGGG